MTKFRISTKVVVRFADTDAMGHVNNIQYFSYMQEGRAAYFQALFPDKSLAKPEEIFPFILADIQCSFKSPVYCGETLIVNLSVTEMRNSSYIMEYEIVEEKSKRLVAVGKSVQVTYDYQKQASKPIPADFRKLVSAFEGRSF